MKKPLMLLLLALAVAACTVKPERLRYSVDNCSFCKMTLEDDKFGGELVSDKGKVFKFDDIKCMVSFLKSSDGQANKYSFELVVDYTHAADEFDLIPASDSFYVLSSEIKSPMAGNIAAFQNHQQQLEYLKKWNGTDLTWDKVKEALK